MIAFLAEAAGEAAYLAGLTWAVTWLVPPRGNRWLETWLGTAVINGAVFAAMRTWPLVAGSAASAIIAAVIWWRRRRKGRRKVLAAMGAKARARIAAMVTTMRERSVPRRTAWEPA